MEEVSEVFEVFDLIEGGRLAVEGSDFGVQFGPDVGAAGEDEEGGGHEGGGGVAARDEGVDDLVAEFFFITAVLGEFVEEDVALVVVVFLGCFIGVAIFFE